MMVQSTTGPVDLSKPENVVRGMVFEDDEGLNRMTVGDGSHEEQWQREAAAYLSGIRFVGLDARYARSEDAKLCCGAGDPGFAPGQNRCTLAIGHNGDHEAIASGVKWAAKAAPSAKRVQVTLAALLKEFDGCQRDHDPQARGVRVLACLPHNQAVRDLATHLETLGGTWRTGSRRVQWPGGSWVTMTTTDRGAFGHRVDVLVGMSTDPWGSLDYHGLRMMVSAPEGPAFWGMRTLPPGVMGMVREMVYRPRAGVYARERDGQFVESGYVDAAWLADVVAGIPRGNVVMAGAPRRQGGLLYDAAQVATERFGQPRVLTIAMGTIRIGEHDVECQVRRREGGQMEVTFPAHPVARISPQVDRYEVTIGGEKVTGIALEGHVEGNMLGRPTVRLTMAEVPNAPEMKPLSEEQKGRLAEWTDDLTRQLHATRKALAGQTAETRMLTKALRAALPDVDRIPWDLVDRKPLHAAAHALCEMAEAATDGGGNGSVLRPMLGEMLGVLRAAEHLPPVTARQMAERTLDAARKAWPRGKK